MEARNHRHFLMPTLVEQDKHAGSCRAFGSTFTKDLLGLVMYPWSSFRELWRVEFTLVVMEMHKITDVWVYVRYSEYAPQLENQV